MKISGFSMLKNGWVRASHLMDNKKKALDTVYKGSKKVNAMYAKIPKEI
jgi:hypothetical protein